MTILIAPAVAAAVIAGLSSLAAGTFNYYSARKTNKESIDYSREAAETAYQRQKDLLDYNSPSYQMSRIVDAGLNPNLAYSNLEGNIPTAPQASQPTLKTPTLDVGLDDALKVAQIERLHTASSNETMLAEGETSNLYKGLELKDAQIVQLKASAESLSQSVVESVARISFLDQSTREKALDAMFKAETFGQRVDLLKNEVNISSAQAASVVRYFGAVCLNLESQAEMYLSQAHLNKENEAVVRALASYYTAQSVGVNQQNFLRQFEIGAAVSPTHRMGSFSPSFLGLEANRSILKQKSSVYQFVDKQRELLFRFGAKQETMKLVLGYSQSLESISNSVSSFLPVTTNTKKSGPGGIIRTSSTSGFFN